MEVIAYTYEADVHCPGCAAKRFGDDALDNPETEDGEGNPIGAVFDTDEQETPLYCGDCLEPITDEGFMELRAEEDDWQVITRANGETDVLPAYVCDERDGDTVETVHGWCSRYSAPGYMDCTEWCGPFATEAEARREAIRLYAE